MSKINTIEELETLYEAVNPMSVTKVAQHITPLYQRWILASKFTVLATVGPEGTDASPRGDDGSVVQVLNENTLLLPDWRGNNRLDCLRNIVRDGRVSLMFMVNGVNNVVRVNGTAELSVSAEYISRFSQKGIHPKSVIKVTVGEVYFQCAKALMRSKLWENSDPQTALPKAGEFLKEAKSDFDAKKYDAGYAEYAKPRMW